jgi:hypothetical protein
VGYFEPVQMLFSSSKIKYLEDSDFILNQQKQFCRESLKLTEQKSGKNFAFFINVKEGNCPSSFFLQKKKLKRYCD